MDVALPLDDCLVDDAAATDEVGLAGDTAALATTLAVDFLVFLTAAFLVASFFFKATSGVLEPVAALAVVFVDLVELAGFLGPVAVETSCFLLGPAAEYCCFCWTLGCA